MVDEHGSPAHAREGPFRPERHAAKVVVVAHTSEDDVAPLGSRAGRRG